MGWLYMRASGKCSSVDRSLRTIVGRPHRFTVGWSRLSAVGTSASQMRRRSLYAIVATKLYVHTTTASLLDGRVIH